VRLELLGDERHVPPPQPLDELGDVEQRLPRLVPGEVVEGDAVAERPQLTEARHEPLIDLRRLEQLQHHPLARKDLRATRVIGRGAAFVAACTCDQAHRAPLSAG
jgi:hypothetical protein